MPVSKTQINKRLLVGIVLDRSFSMDIVRAETISGTNEQFSALRDYEDVENTYVAMWTFNQLVTPVFTSKDGNGKEVPALVEAKTLKNLGEGDYIPSGMTAMRDGVGDAIDFLQAEAKKGDSVLVVVISDGYENASKRYSEKTIASQVKELQESGWTFTYIGANQDLAKVQKQFGFHEGNTLSYTSDSDGTGQMYKVVASSMRSYAHARSAALSRGESSFSSTNLYSPEDRAKLDSSQTFDPDNVTNSDSGGTSSAEAGTTDKDASQTP